jgi:hypothetical protein
MTKGETMFRVLLVSLLFAVPASAQTVERTIDLSELGWGHVQAVPVDTDANPATEEWAIRSMTTNHWRVVAVREHGLCVGDWFDPRPSGLYGVTVATIGGQSKLLVTKAFTAGPLLIVRLDTPRCE